VVDSVQTVQSGDAGALSGAVTPLRECTARLVRFAKSTGTAVVIIGHVTKEGAIAGPAPGARRGGVGGGIFN
jgi:DNA repair protein RadA/Sms